MTGAAYRLDVQDGGAPAPPAPPPPRTKSPRALRKLAELRAYEEERDERDRDRRRGMWLRSRLPAIARGELGPFTLKGVQQVPGMTVIGAAWAGFCALAFALENRVLVASHAEMAAAITLWLAARVGPVPAELADLVIGKRGRKLAAGLKVLRAALHAQGVRTCSIAAARDWASKFRRMAGWVLDKQHFGERRRGPGHCQLSNSYAPGLDAWGEVRAAQARWRRRDALGPEAGRSGVTVVAPVVLCSAEKLQTALPARARTYTMGGAKGGDVASVARAGGADAPGTRSAAAPGSPEPSGLLPAAPPRPSGAPAAPPPEGHEGKASPPSGAALAFAGELRRALDAPNPHRGPRAELAEALAELGAADTPDAAASRALAFLRRLVTS